MARKTNRKTFVHDIGRFWEIYLTIRRAQNARRMELAAIALRTEALNWVYFGCATA